MTTQEGNKLIAEFDGFKFINDDPKVYPNGYYITNSEGENIIRRENEFEYHSSWDWIMPVWYKFRNLKFTGLKQEWAHSDLKQAIAYVISYEDIVKVHSLLVDGIEWYMQNKES